MKNGQTLNLLPYFLVGVLCFLFGLLVGNVFRPTDTERRVNITATKDEVKFDVFTVSEGVDYTELLHNLMLNSDPSNQSFLRNGTLGWMEKTADLKLEEVIQLRSNLIPELISNSSYADKIFSSIENLCSIPQTPSQSIKQTKELISRCDDKKTLIGKLRERSFSVRSPFHLIGNEISIGFPGGNVPTSTCRSGDYYLKKVTLINPDDINKKIEEINLISYHICPIINGKQNAADINLSKADANTLFGTGPYPITKKANIVIHGQADIR